MRLQLIALSGAALLALAACNGAAGGAGAAATPIPQTDAEKLQVATDIATAINGPEALDRMMQGGGMMPDLTAACAAAPADKQEACKSTMAARQALVKPIMDDYIAKAKTVLPDMQKDMAAAIAKSFSGAELARMKDFYVSPEGKSITQKLPGVLAEAYPKMMDRLQPLLVDMSAKVAAAVSGPPAPQQ